MSSRVISGGVVHTVPMDLRRVLIATPKALAAWQDLTPLARYEWICWVLWPKKAETRSQQHGRRFPSSSSDRTRWTCWLLVSAFFGQSTQQIHSLRARGVRSCHAASAFGVAIKTRLKSIGTVWTTPPEITLELIDRPSYPR